MGMKVSEPADPRAAESLVHCYVQWFLRDKWILEPFDEEQQQRLVDHAVCELWKKEIQRRYPRGPLVAEAYIHNDDYGEVSFREQLTLHRVVQVIHEVAVHGRDPFLSERFLFDKDGVEQSDFTLAAYSLGMMHH